MEKDLESSTYIGDKNNKTDLTDDNYHYKGRQDDDDFVKLEVIPKNKPFDLSLQKFVTKVNGTPLANSREPKVDVTNLKNGTSTDAKYDTIKTALPIKIGDIVTYTIRIYNEGEMSGYAEEVSDYLPEGLGFLVQHKTNVDNYWSIPSGSTTVKLNTLENGKLNLKPEDFVNIQNLDDVEVLKGKVKLTSTKLKSEENSKENLIKAFDKQNGNELDYKDIEVTCIVLSTDSSNNNLRNIAEIAKNTDENRENVEDIDSVPNSVNQDNYYENESNQDDDDYENLVGGEAEKEKKFDLSLQKFITGLNNEKITGREPNVVKDENGNLKINKSNVQPLPVANNDTIIYTIRVYNEGDTAGYAKEVSDNLPKGLEYIKDHEINKKYGWKLYDNSGNETTDLNQAVSVKTDYLSKEKSEERKEDCLLQPYDAEKGSLSYRDIEIAFKVDESQIDSSRKIINVAEITDDEDKDGNPVEDIDSTPGNNKDGEDDIDREQVYVKFFDLSLKKDLIKIVINENGTDREISVTSTDGLQKVEVHRKRIDSTVVKFVYLITVTNEGEIAGYATEITDYIPAGLEFIQEDNPKWNKVSDSTVTTNALSDTILQPGQSASVQIILKWVNGDNNFGLKVNRAEISEDKNDSNSNDIDSIPGNNKDGEDDIDEAPVMLAISTGTVRIYIALATAVLAILTTGVILIRKYVLP